MRDVDINEVLRYGTLRYQPYGQLPLSVPLGTYYKRHLFQTFRVVEGKKIWTYTDDGVLLAERLQSLGRDRIREELVSLKVSNGYQWSSCFISRLVDYIQNRGRMVSGALKVATLDERLAYPVFYKYSGDLDAATLGWKFVSDSSCGNDVVGYKRPSSAIKLKQFLESGRVYFDAALEPAFHDYVTLHRLSRQHKQVYKDWKEQYEQRLKTCV